MSNNPNPKPNQLEEFERAELSLNNRFPAIHSSPTQNDLGLICSTSAGDYYVKSAYSLHDFVCSLPVVGFENEFGLVFHEIYK